MAEDIDRVYTDTTEGGILREVVEEVVDDVVPPAVEEYVSGLNLVTANDVPQTGVSIVDENEVPLVTVMSPQDRPYLKGSSPVDAIETPGDSLTVIDENGVPIFEIDPSSGGGGDTGTFTKTWLIPVCGQSNAMGILASPTADQTNEPLSNLFAVPQSGALAGTVQPAREPLAHSKGTAGPGTRGFAVAFGRWLALQNPDVRVVLVPVAVSGTGLYFTGGNGTEYTWAPDMEGEPGGGISLYREAIQKTNAVAAMFTNVSVPVVLWHQGESDAVGNITTAGYTGDATHGLLGLIDGFRSGMTGASADTIFIAGQQAWEFRNVRQPGTYAQIDAALASLPSKRSRTGFATAPGQGYCNPDNTHFTGHGQWLLAQSYITAYETALYNL
ncbi:sialate O-acetylesterase [Microbacterium gubbeenense]|uniref:sialate O-acetylesterase n=1 Tax=Microbacterium gubbeenense TaxID=159896 RepID=UPI003F96EB73